MAQISMNAYDADVYIPEFRGLMQAGDQMGGDLRFSPDCMNIETPNGVLQPVAKMLKTKIGTMAYPNYYPFTGKAGTAMYLRAMTPYWPLDPNAAQSSQSTGFEYRYSDLYFIIQRGYLYSFEVDYDTKDVVCSPVATSNTTTLPNTGWSWCTYSETLTSDIEYDDPGGTITIPAGTVSDVLLFSHPDVGLMKYSHLLQSYKKVTTPARFEFIARYAERIWGVGHGDDKDSIYYSRPYSTTNWTQNNNNPANGGGVIKEPTWDDDKFTALIPFSDALIAFTEKRAWRITGTDPSNFSLQEQYGNGTKYPETAVVYDKYIIMLGEDGLVRYDGYSITPYLQESTREIFRRIVSPGLNGEPTSYPVATRAGNKYIIAFPNELFSPFVAHPSDSRYEGSSIIPADHPVESIGYQMIVIDQESGSVTRMDVPKVISFFKTKPSMLAYVDGNSPYVCFTRLTFDSWHEQRITEQATRWITPWVTFGRMDIKKGGFDLYFTPELRKEKRITHQLSMTVIETSTPEYETEDIAGPVTFRLSIQTEKKTKTKEYTVNPLTDEEIASGKKYKMKKLHFGGSGRRFRLIIETDAGNTIPWRLIGGIHLIVETDKD